MGDTIALAEHTKVEGALFLDVAVETLLGLFRAAKALAHTSR